MKGTAISDFDSGIDILDSFVTNVVLRGSECHFSIEVYLMRETQDNQSRIQNTNENRCSLAQLYKQEDRNRGIPQLCR